MWVEWEEVYSKGAVREVVWEEGLEGFIQNMHPNGGAADSLCSNKQAWAVNWVLEGSLIIIVSLIYSKHFIIYYEVKWSEVSFLSKS